MKLEAKIIIGLLTTICVLLTAIAVRIRDDQLDEVQRAVAVYDILKYLSEEHSFWVKEKERDQGDPVKTKQDDEHIARILNHIDGLNPLLRQSRIAVVGK